MSYPINQPITYTAVAVTTGFPSNSFTYAWTFDDVTSATGATYAKTWTSAASHLATVIATDTVTGGTATATKTIVVKDWSTLTWVLSSNSMLPTGSGIASTYGLSLYTADKYLIYVGEYYHPEVLVVMDTLTNTVAQYTNATVGAMSSCYLLSTGANAGKLLVLGVSSGKYAFVDLATGIFTIGSSPLAFLYPTLNGTLRTEFAMMGNGKLYVPCFGYNGSIYQNQCMTYDPINDVWANAASWAGTPLLNGSYLRCFPLPSGKVFILCEATSPYGYIVNGTTQTVTTGPASTPLMSTGGFNTYAIEQLPNKSLVGMKTGVNPSVMGTFVEGAGDWSFAATGSPTINNTSSNQMIVTSDGFPVSVGRAGGDTPTTTIFYSPANDSWIQGAVLPYNNAVAYKAFAGGRLWRCTAQGNLYYMVW